MNFFKKLNFLVLNWAIEALSKDSNEFQDESKPTIDFAVGGQAVIEGVMMRSPNHITIAVRKPDGEMKVRKKHYHTLTQRYKWLNIPILRGVINLFEMMVIGTDAINFSANEQMDDTPQSGAKKQSASEASNKSPFSKFVEYAMFTISFIFAMALSVGLFKFIPLWITTFLESNSTYIQSHYIVFNLIDGAIKMSIFLGYIFILSLIPNFRRVFEYHGAEHKSIFAYENKEPLEVPNAKKQTRFHPRCGTSFILIVFVVSILVYTFIPKQETFWLNLAVRLAVLPLIAGISYEYLKLSARHANKTIVKALIAPGLWFQRLTTKEPDDKQLAVGLQSLKEALALESA